MSILFVIGAILAVGIVLYCINRFAPMEGNVKTILNWVVIAFLVIFLLKALGVFEMLSRIKI